MCYILSKTIEIFSEFFRSTLSLCLPLSLSLWMSYILNIHTYVYTFIFIIIRLYTITTCVYVKISFPLSFFSFIEALCSLRLHCDFCNTIKKLKKKLIGLCLSLSFVRNDSYLSLCLTLCFMIVNRYKRSKASCSA